jgi:hypothetical protein
MFSLEVQLSGENTSLRLPFQIAREILNARASQYRQVPWNDFARRSRRDASIRVAALRDQNPPQ